MSENHLFYILEGIMVTLQYTLISAFFGFFIALLVCFMRIAPSKILNLISIVYVSVIRGTPVVLQLSIWYFVFPQATGCKISAFTAGTLTFAINSSAYLAEVIRTGINTINKGQIEAAKVIGLTKKDTFFDIIIPQALSHISPAIVNEIISLTIKTSIIGLIGVTDLTRRAQLVSAETYDFFEPILVAGFGYYCLALGITGIYAFIIRTKKNKGSKF